MLSLPKWLLKSGWLVFSVMLIACSSARKTQPSEPGGSHSKDKEAGKSFSAEYTKKLGVPVPETANRQLIAFVSEWIGVPYKYGGNDKAGVDCSGFISQVYPNVFNIRVPRNTSQLQQNANHVPRNGLKEGDLVFFRINTKEVGHAGIYLFNDFFVHSSTSRGVIISKLDDIYWNKYFVGGGRFSN